ncbi:hypothetical protein MASR2M8_25170 [Opitutaceae bacterium]
MITSPETAAAGRGVRRRFPLRLVLFGAAAVTAVAFGFLAHTAAEAGRLIQHYGYYAMAATVVWWLFALGRRLPAARAWIRAESPSDRRPVLFLTLGLAVVAFATFPYSYKVLYDELVLQATAWNLHYFREVGTAVRGYPVEGVFTSFNIYLDKRPYFFPFVLSLLHDLTGYRETNGFILNTLLLPVVLGLFYALARRLADARAALAGLACFGASALLAQNATGVGMELLNLAMMALAMLLAADYLEQPDEDRLSALILTCVLLAQTRYESSLYVLPAALAVLEGWRRAGRVILPAPALFAPILLIPCALHNTYLSGTPVLWELRENMDSRFGAEYVVDNLRHAFTYFFNIAGVQLNAWWLAIAGWLALGWAAWTLVRNLRQWKSAPAGALTAVLFAFAVLANLMLLMAYFWGQLDDPIVARLVLPFNVILGLAIAWAAQRMAPRAFGPQVARVLIGGALLVHVGFALSASARHTTINQLASELAWEGRVVETMPPKNRFIITNKSSLAWLMRRIPVVTVDRARFMSDRVKFHLDHATFEEVLVTQLLRPTNEEGSFVVDPKDLLPDDYVLEPVVERHIGARIARISRVVAIRVPERAETLAMADLPEAVIQPEGSGP